MGQWKDNLDRCWLILSLKGVCAQHCSHVIRLRLCQSCYERLTLIHNVLDLLLPGFRTFKEKLVHGVIHISSFIHRIVKRPYNKWYNSLKLNVFWFHLEFTRFLVKFCWHANTDNLYKWIQIPAPLLCLTFTSHCCLTNASYFCRLCVWVIRIMMDSSTLRNSPSICAPTKKT